MMKAVLKSDNTKSSVVRTNALSERSRYVIWARAAGRCQYTGCNRSLIGDLISGVEDRNFGFIAHIVGDKPTGPRGDAVRSAALSDDVANLMLLCYTHHKLIDVDAIDDHPEDRLLAIKAAHESRIETVSAIKDDRASHVLRYAAAIGQHESAVRFEDMASAMLPGRYPAERRHILDLEIRGLDRRDNEPDFWRIQQENLTRQFRQRVTERIAARDVHHISVFALAPQPLLIELGRQLGDIVPINVHQLHREPKGWRWAEDGDSIDLTIGRPDQFKGTIALVLALSATVVDNRVATALGAGASIWSIRATAPHNDILRRKDDLMEFRRHLRSLLNEIKAAHGEGSVIHVFPALPLSAAVEVGRVWMPKADLPMAVYDQNRENGFVQALMIA